MHVGVCHIKLRLPENLSLKGKRRVLKSITTRVRNKFNVSIAEVDHCDNIRTSVLGVAMIAGETRFITSALSKIVEFLGGEVAAGPLTSQNLQPPSHTEPNYPSIVTTK